MTDSELIYHPIHLRLSVIGLTEHPQAVMRNFGITYQHATPQSMGDQWWFWNCENVPNPLPDGLTILDVRPLDMIGWGLSREQAEEIELWTPN